MISSEVLRLENITQRYEKEIVLKSINLVVKQGEYLVIRGRSGVGKTSLVRIMALIDKPFSGKIYFMGREVSSMSDADRALLRLKHIGYIDQYYTLIDNLSVLENILLPVKLLGKYNEENRSLALYYLERLGLKNKAYRFPNELSGGEKQRVAIIRALIKKPLLIIGDEPYSNLDDRTRLLVEEILLGYIKEFNASIVVTTTDLYTKYESMREYLLVNGFLQDFK